MVPSVPNHTLEKESGSPSKTSDSKWGSHQVAALSYFPSVWPTLDSGYNRNVWGKPGIDHFAYLSVLNLCTAWASHIFIAFVKIQLFFIINDVPHIGGCLGLVTYFSGSFVGPILGGRSVGKDKPMPRTTSWLELRFSVEQVILFFVILMFIEKQSFFSFFYHLDVS